LIRRPGQAFAPVGGDQVAKNPINNGVLPAFAVAVPLSDRLAFGLAVSSPYSFTTDYSEDSWARYTADKTKLLTVDIQPSVAYAVTDWLRAGAALNVEYTDASLSNALPNLLASLPDGRQVLKGNGWDLGWSAGVQMHNDFVTVGISYKSEIEHKLEGSLEVSGLLGPLATQNRALDGVTATFYTPAQIIVGARFKVSPALTLNTQAVRYTWHKFDAIRLGAPINQAIPEGYQNSWSLAGGVDFQASEKLTLRAGVQRASTPTVDGERDARVPDADRWNFGTGGTFQLSPRLALDAAFNYVDFENETIDRTTAAYAGTAAQTPILVNGTLRDAKAFIISLGGRMTF
jgi:long-chain fatty acid transport protein